VGVKQVRTGSKDLKIGRIKGFTREKEVNSEKGNCSRKKGPRIRKKVLQRRLTA